MKHFDDRGIISSYQWRQSPTSKAMAKLLYPKFPLLPNQMMMFFIFALFPIFCSYVSGIFLPIVSPDFAMCYFIDMAISMPVMVGSPPLDHTAVYCLDK